MWVTVEIITIIEDCHVVAMFAYCKEVELGMNNEGRMLIAAYRLQIYLNQCFIVRRKQVEGIGYIVWSIFPRKTREAARLKGPNETHILKRTMSTERCCAG